MAKRTRKADSSGKRTAHLYAQAWAEWITHQAQLTVEAELSGEFQIITRTTDVLLRVRNRRGVQFLVLVELQLHYDPAMSRRLAAYAALAREKYKLEVYVAVVYLLEPPADTVVAQQFHSRFMGQTAHQDFALFRIWDFAATDALALNNPALLPFVPLMRGGDNVTVLQNCVTRIRQEAAAEELEMLLAAFASFVMDVATIRQLLRWDMKILRESPFYQELFKDYEQGRADGREEGREEALAAELETLRRFAVYRFQVAPTYFDTRLQHLDLAAVRQLTQQLFDLENLSAFEAALNEWVEGL